MLGFNQSQGSLPAGYFIRQASKVAGMRAEVVATDFTRFLSRCREKAAAVGEMWRPEPAVSSETYFENNHGFAEAELPFSPSTSAATNSRVDNFLRPDNNAAIFQQTRGFKTRRSDTLSDSASEARKTSVFQSLFFGENPARSAAPAPNTRKNDVDSLAELLKSSELQSADKDKVLAAINGYAAGLSAARKNDDDGGESSGKSGKKATSRETVKRLAVAVAVTAVVGSLLYNTGLRRIMRFNMVQEITPEEIDVTFDDVKGCEEAKQELKEVVDFLMNPEKYRAIGGKLPKGCLLVGPPGTGKTLLARAVAGQAGVPFFYTTGSAFDEVLVGQGARRMRDLFQAAKSRAPCVIFIDEIDSVGGKRTSSSLHPYANQTINQLLSEMDGFVANEGVIVLGATNRADQLDKALLRPGRFDTKVMVQIPDIQGRREIISYYLSRIKHDSSVDVELLARRTVRFSGADLENLVNQAAIRAAVEGKPFVTKHEFEQSFDKHVLGPKWKSRVRDKDDLRLTAYHEAGHALVCHYTSDAQPLHKVTIIAQGQSGGHTSFVPERETVPQTRNQLTASVDVLMGGRAAEELIGGPGNVTTGPSSDMVRSTSIVNGMVKQFGMSDKIGLRVYEDDHNSPATTEAIDKEIDAMLGDSYKRAFAILGSHRRELDAVAEALMRYETIDGADIKHLAAGGCPKDLDAKYGKKTVKHAVGNKKLPGGLVSPAGGGELVH